MLISGFIALTLTPMMCSLLLKHNPKPSRFFDRWMEKLLDVDLRVAYQPFVAHDPYQAV